MCVSYAYEGSDTFVLSFLFVLVLVCCHVYKLAIKILNIICRLMTPCGVCNQKIKKYISQIAAVGFLVCVCVP